MSSALRARLRLPPLLPMAALASAALFGGVCARVAHAAAASSAANATELDHLKAGFLFKFLSFVEWPAAALPAHEEFRLALVAPPAIFQAMAANLSGKKVAGRALVIVRLDPYPPAPGPRPHAVFVHETAEVGPAVLVAHYRNQPVLIVGDAPGFVADGGMIGLLLRAESLRFQISLTAAARAGLQISSQLASLAEIVKEPTP